MKNMESRVEKAQKLFREGYNCAQSVFAAYSDIYGVDTNTALRIAASFGGGMGRMREVCGALSGAFMIAGLENGSVDGSDAEGKKANYDLVNVIAEEFKKVNGTIICRELLGLDKEKKEACKGECKEKTDTTPQPRTEEYYKKRPCEEMVALCARIIEEVIIKPKTEGVYVDFMKVNSPDDVVRVSDMADRIWRENYKNILSEEQIDYMIDNFQSPTAITRQMVNEHYEYYLLDNDEAYIGYVAFVKEKEKLFISKIYLLSEFQHKGYGKATVDKIRDIAISEGINKIWLTVNKNNVNAIKAYEKYGFENKDSTITDIGNDFVMDDYIMEMQLN